MSALQIDGHAATALERIRHHTQRAHRRLEDRLDAVARLADPAQRAALVERFRALHVPADAALRGELAAVEGLGFAERERAALFAQGAAAGDLPAFPVPTSRAEALGMLYVLEGSSLGGRVILRSLAARGVVSDALAFLDPYGERTGRLWRSFLAVLARETTTADEQAQAVRGAERGFAHAERVLCEGLT